MLVLLLGLVLLGGEFVHAQAVIDTPRFSLRFDASGRAVELLDKRVGKNLLAHPREVQGFIATIEDASSKRQDVLLRVDTDEDGALLLTHEAFKARVAVNATDRYLAMRVVSIEPARGYGVVGLSFKLYRVAGLKVTPLDYMTERIWRMGWTGAAMPYLWAESEGDPLGTFALSIPIDEADEDETLMHLWVSEGLPHPKVEGEWTIDRARQWLKDWQATFEDQSTMILGASSLEELYRLTDKAKAIGMKRVYLHTDVWRGEYWPRHNSFLHINRDIFPAGEEDLRKFTAYCKKLGLGVAIHVVSCSIAPGDQDYMKPVPDARLSRWTRGTLAEAAEAKATTLYFKPAPGQIFPRVDDSRETDRRGLTYSYLDTRLLRIGNELIEVGKFSQTHDDVWLLEHCRRGFYETTPAGHLEDAAVSGLYRAYRQVFVPDPSTDMLDEIVQRYADFCNRNGITHMECDGLEIHRSLPWGPSKFAWKLYEQLDHPCSSNTSNGRPLEYQIECWFNSSREVMNNHPRGGVAGGEGVPLYLHQEDRVATGPYELLLKPTYRLSRGGKSFHLMRPRPMFGVSERLIEEHGLSDYALSLFPKWREAADALSPKQIATIHGGFGSSERPFSRGDHDRYTHTLLRPAEVQGRTALVPLRVMQPPGKAAKWGWGQEFGPIVPRGYIRPGQAVTLNNPYHAQTPEFVIRVMNALQDEPVERDAPDVEVEQAEGSNILDAYNQSAGQANAAHPLAEARHIWAAGGLEDGMAKRGVVGVRKSFTVDEPGTLDSAVLVFQVDDSLSVAVNGKALRVQGTPRKALMVDLLPCLQKGRNVLAIQASNGGGPGMVTAAVILTRGNEQRRISSGKDWKAVTDLDRGWQKIDFDESDWPNAADLGAYGTAGWHRRNVEVASFDANLMPKPGQVRKAGNNNVTIEGNTLRVRINNPGKNPLIEIEQLPVWAKAVNMSSARGIGMTVTGDGSGAVLVVSVAGAGQRDYPIRLDFKGKRDIVIPSGEVAFGSPDWGWTGKKYSLQYGSVRQIKLGAAYVPANASVDVRVENLRILHEQPASLIDPVIRLGDTSMKIQGRVPSGTYLWYRGGDQVTLHDLNWKQVGKLPILTNGFIAPSGPSDFVLEHQEAKSQPWLEYQFVVSAPPISLKSQQD